MKRIVVNEAVITFNAGINLTADTAKREIKGKMARGDTLRTTLSLFTKQPGQPGPN